MLISVLEVISEASFEEVILLGDIRDQPLNVLECEFFYALVIKIDAS
jgi:hypothetical protein